MNMRAWWIAGALVLGAGIVACGGDEAMQPAAPIGAAGYGGGTSGTGASGTGAAGTGSGAVMCGANTCMPAMGVMGIPARPRCCADQAMGTCGFMSGQGVCNPPLPVAPLCPPPMFPGATACCTTTNVCGVDATALDMGCFDFSSFAPNRPKTMCDGTTVAPPAAGSTGGAAGATGAAGTAAGAGGTGAAAGAGGTGAAAGAGGTGAAAGAGGTGAAAGAGGTGAAAGAGGRPSGAGGSTAGAGGA